MVPQDHTHGYLYNCGLSSPSSRSPPQSMFPSMLVPQRRQHDREQAPPRPTPPSNDSPRTYRLRPLEQLPTSSPRRWEPYVANVPWGASPSSTLPLPCSQYMGRQLIEPLDVKYSANIHSMKITSNECISEVQSLLSCPLKISRTRSIQGNQAQSFVDSLDRVSGYYVRHTSAAHGVEYRFLHGHVSMVNSSSAAYDFFPRSAKQTGSFPHRIFSAGSSCALDWFTTRVGLRS